MIEGLLIAIAALLVLTVGMLIALLLQGRPPGPAEIENAVSSSWVRLGLGEAVGAIEVHAQDIRQNYVELERMLRAPAARGRLGELSLESQLADQLSPGMYGIRQRVLDGKVPDAWIDSTVGLICIDSKFPLDNFRAMLDAPDEATRTTLAKRFRRNVRAHLRKVAQDYVCPVEGSAEFAFVYVPSEAVYYHLATEAYDLLREATDWGVQVVSPLTLGHKLALIRSGAAAVRLSDDAQQVRDHLIALGARFAQLREAWRVFHGTHLRNLTQKADEIDAAYARLGDAFARVSDEYL